MLMDSPVFALDREPAVTAARHSVAARLRHLVWAAALLGLVACGGGGGGKPKDTYAKATDVQGDCCEKLQGDARASCLQQVVRVDDPGVASSSVNQQTYACVVDHFVCDPSTGKPTQESAQKQLECIQDLAGQ